MAKELPYFKFEPNQWENGNIQMCSREHKGLFIDLCSMYWSRIGDLPLKLAIQKLCAGNATALISLCDDNIIAIESDYIRIDFLEEQLLEFKNTSSQNSKNAKEGWEKRRGIKVLSDRNATASNTQSENDAIREEKRRKDKINNSLLSEIKISDDKKFFLIKDLQIEAEQNEIEYFKIAEKFQKLFIKNLKEKKSPTANQEKANFKNYVSPIRLLLENKEATKEQLREAYSFLNSIEGEFWKSNILSTATLRKQIATLIAKKNIVKVPQNKKEENIPDHKKRNQL